MDGNVNGMIENGKSRKMFWTRVASNVTGFAIGAIVLYVISLLFGWPISGARAQAAAPPQTQTAPQR